MNSTGYGTTPAKNVRYNSTNMLDFCRDKGKVPTIEFRQHEGTLNPDDVVQWIKTVVGIVNYVDTESDANVDALLERVRDEKWVKQGDGKDNE